MVEENANGDNDLITLEKAEEYRKTLVELFEARAVHALISKETNFEFIKSRAESTEAAAQAIDSLIKLEDHMCDNRSSRSNERSHGNNDTSFHFMTTDEAEKIRDTLTALFDIRAKVGVDTSSDRASTHTARSMNAKAAIKAMDTITNLSKHMNR